MVAYRQTLRYFPTSAACFVAMDSLLLAFKTEFKRNATINLCYSLSHEHAVTLHADDYLVQANEIAWFERAASTL